MNVPKYCIRIVNKDASFYAYLTKGNKQSWCKRIAIKHCREYNDKNKQVAFIEFA